MCPWVEVEGCGVVPLVEGAEGASLVWRSLEFDTCVWLVKDLGTHGKDHESRLS